MISTTIPSPAYVQREASETRGVDLLALRLPAQTIRDRLLNGITTVTPLIRYLSLRTWLIVRYVRQDPPPPDRWNDFVKHARRYEAIFALASLARDRSTLSLVGANKANEQLKSGPGPYSLNEHPQQSSMNVYAGSSDQLRLTRGKPNGRMPDIGADYGLPLARIVDDAFTTTSLGRRIHAMEPIESVTREELEEFGAVAWVNEVPDAERDALLAALLPEHPRPDDLPRMATYAALLSLAGDLAEGTHGLQEGHLFAEALASRRTTPAVLHDALDGWALYAVRDAIAVTAEFTLAAVLRTLYRLDPDRLGHSVDRVVETLVEQSANEQLAALGELGLRDGSGDLATLRLSTLVDRVGRATSEATTVSDNGVQRWDGNFTEMTLWHAAPGFKDGALVAGVLAWLLAAIRTGDAVRRGLPSVVALSHEGMARFGMEQVILPRLDDWRARDPVMAELLIEFAHLVIDQHVRIAWSRLAQDPRKDISVLLRDGDQVMLGRAFAPGRTASRIWEAIGWLNQLGLLRNNRLTPFGRAILDRTLRTLAAAGGRTNAA